MSNDNSGQPPKKTMMGWNASHSRAVPAEQYTNRTESRRPTTEAETIVDNRFGDRLAAEISAGHHAPQSSQLPAHLGGPQGDSAPQQSFSAPPQQSFGAPPQQNFGAPPQQSYGAPPQQNYGAPPQQNFGAPPQQNYGAPPQQNFGAPPQQNFGAPPQQNFAGMGMQNFGPQLQNTPPHVSPNSSPGPQNNYGQPAPHGYGQNLPNFVQPEFAQGTSPEEPNPSKRPIVSADATAGQNHRVRFIRLTYLHLFLAIAVFAGLEYLFLRTSIGTPVQKLVLWPMMKFGGRLGWGIILAAFVGGGYVAERWAMSDVSKGMQYLGLAFYVVLEALIFIPLLLIAEVKAAEYAIKYGSEAHFIRDAALITMALFGGLTVSVFVSKKDFSFLRSGLFAGAGVAAGLIVMSLVFGFQLGMVFSAAMIVLAGGYVLYYTSQVLAHYRPSQHVAASLALFSAVALMFWYVLRLLMRLRQ